MKKLPIYLFALFLAFALGACQTEETEPGLAEEEGLEQQADEGVGQQQMGAVDAEEIEGDPEEYMGRTVRIDGEIAEVYGQNAFSLEGDWLGGNLLVVVPSDVNAAGTTAGAAGTTTDAAGTTFNVGDNVQITGTVRQYMVTEIENEYGLDLAEEIEYEEQEPVVIAQQVNTGVMEQESETGMMDQNTENGALDQNN